MPRLQGQRSRSLKARTGPFAFFVASTALLAACVVGPRYHPPSTPASAARPFVAARSGTADAPLPPYWWRLYRDPVLDGLVQQALLENEALKVAAANLAYAQGLTQEALSGRFPTTTLSTGGTFERLRTPEAGVPSGSSFVYSAGFAASYEIDLFGRVRRTIEAARANAEAQLAAEDQVRVTVAAATAGAYAGVCGYGEQIVVAQRSLAILQSGYDLAVVQRDAGTLSDFDVDREAVLLQQAKAAIPPLLGYRDTAMFTLAALIGRTPGDLPAAVATCVRPPTIDHPLPVGDGARMLRRRPDLREAERNLAAATARIGVATAALYPTVALGGAISSAATQLAGLGSASRGVFSIGPLLTYSFPNPLVARARIRQSSAQASAALATFDGDVVNALRDTDAALATYAHELDHHEALAAAAAAANDALKLANIQFTAGAASFIDLLAAQSTAVAADQASAASDQSLVADQISVFQDLGGGWEGAPTVAYPRIP